MPDDQAIPKRRPRLYRAYLIRFWRDSQGSPWRASALSVRDGQTIHFSTLQALYSFFDMQCQEAIDRTSAHATDETGRYAP